MLDMADDGAGSVVKRINAKGATKLSVIEVVENVRRVKWNFCCSTDVFPRFYLDQHLVVSSKQCLLETPSPTYSFLQDRRLRDNFRSNQDVLVRSRNEHGRPDKTARRARQLRT